MNFNMNIKSLAVPLCKIKNKREDYNKPCTRIHYTAF